MHYYYYYYYFILYLCLGCLLVSCSSIIEFDLDKDKDLNLSDAKRANQQNFKILKTIVQNYESNLDSTQLTTTQEVHWRHEINKRTKLIPFLTEKCQRLIVLHHRFLVYKYHINPSHYIIRSENGPPLYRSNYIKYKDGVTIFSFSRSKTLPSTSFIFIPPLFVRAQFLACFFMFPLIGLDELFKALLNTEGKTDVKSTISSNIRTFHDALIHFGKTRHIESLIEILFSEILSISIEEIVKDKNQIFKHPLKLHESDRTYFQKMFKGTLKSSAQIQTMPTFNDFVKKHKPAFYDIAVKYIQNYEETIPDVLKNTDLCRYMTTKYIMINAYLLSFYKKEYLNLELVTAQILGYGRKSSMLKNFNISVQLNQEIKQVFLTVQRNMI